MTAIAVDYAKSFLNVGLRGVATVSFGLAATYTFEGVCRLVEKSYATAKAGFKKEAQALRPKEEKKSGLMDQLLRYNFRPIGKKRTDLYLVASIVVTGLVGYAASELAHLAGQPDAFNAALKWVSPFQMGPGRFPLTQSVLDFTSRTISWIRS